MSDLIPTPGSKWRHYNGAEYTVLYIANGDDNPRYPLSIVYQGANGRVWVRHADDWHRSMKEITT